jgi:hypothetical protein
MDVLTNLASLRQRWQACKTTEDAARAERLAVEQDILAHFPRNKVEGSITDKDAGVTVTFKVTRKVNSEALANAWPLLSENAHRAFKWSAEVNTPQLRALNDLDPALFGALGEFISTTPAKPAITIKECPSWPSV